MEPISAKNEGAHSFLIQRAQRLVVPLGVHIDVTYRCDLTCEHCYLTSRKRDEMTLAEYETLFDEFQEMGTLFLLISGGEIFHRPDGIDILEAACRRRFDTRIITHGGHITADVADRLAAMGLRAAAMSVYAADAETHEAVTTVPGSFERTMRGARELRRVGIPVVFKCQVYSRNKHVIEGMQALAREMDVTLEFGHNIKGDNEGSDELSELNVGLDDQVAIYGCAYPALADAESLGYFSPDSHTCMAGNASCYVSPDGTVQPCLDWLEDAGNIRTQSFRDIWESSPVLVRTRDIRRGSFSGCSSCENFDHCGLCPARSLRETGDPTGSAPSKCRQTTARVVAHRELRRART